MFQKSPSEYLGIKSQWMIYAVDLACAVACWEDENQKYEDARKKAEEEAEHRGNALDSYKNKL